MSFRTFPIKVGHMSILCDIIGMWPIAAMNSGMAAVPWWCSDEAPPLVDTCGTAPPADDGRLGAGWSLKLS